MGWVRLEPMFLATAQLVPIALTGLPSTDSSSTNEATDRARLVCLAEFFPDRKIAFQTSRWGYGFESDINLFVNSGSTEVV